MLFLILKWANDSLRLKIIQNDLLSIGVILKDNDFEFLTMFQKMIFYIEEEFYNFQFDDLLSKNDDVIGWIFMDYRNLNNSINYNTIIYAHGWLDETMFGAIKMSF